MKQYKVPRGTLRVVGGSGRLAGPSLAESKRSSSQDSSGRTLLVHELLLLEVLKLFRPLLE